MYEKIEIHINYNISNTCNETIKPRDEYLNLTALFGEN